VARVSVEYLSDFFAKCVRCGAKFRSTLKWVGCGIDTELDTESLLASQLHAHHDENSMMGHNNYRLYANEQDLTDDPKMYGRGLACGFIALGTSAFNGEVWKVGKGVVLTSGQDGSSGGDQGKD